MAKNFKKIENFEDLKAQYKDLLKIHHPDNGGDVAKMQEINAEYDALFTIWKDRHEEKTGEKVKETAESTRNQFYTEFGWEGANHDWRRDITDVAKIVKSYIKEKYPTYKFSVRSARHSMTTSLYVKLKEAPSDIYKQSPGELTLEERDLVHRRLDANFLFNKSSWTKAELDAAIQKAWSEDKFYRVYNDSVNSMIKDIDAFVESYNYSDSDSRIDYFHVDFYYFGVSVDSELKIVPRPSKNVTQQIEEVDKEKSDKKITEEENKNMYEVKVSKLENDSRTIGMASLVINGNMKFNGIRLIKNDSDRGFFVTMPSYKTKDGEYKNIFNPISPEMAASLADAASESLQTGKAVSFETGSEKAETVFVAKSIAGPQKANVRIVFNKDFVCDSIVVRENKDGNLFVAMPSYKSKDETYKEFCHPITADFRTQINDEIFQKYEYAMGTKDLQKEQNDKGKTEPSSSGRSGR